MNGNLLPDELKITDLTSIYTKYVCRLRLMSQSDHGVDQAGQWMPLHFAKEMEERALHVATGETDCHVGTVEYAQRAEAFFKDKDVLPILPLENLMER